MARMNGENKAGAMSKDIVMVLPQAEEEGV